MTPEQTQHLEQMTLWLIEHPKIQEALCSECFSPKGGEILDAFRKLKSQGYYELLTLFLMRSQVTYEGQRALDRFCVTHLTREAGRVGPDSLLEELEALLSEEIQRHAAKADG
ncbi:MAG: hypothetical protein IJX52_03365 [Oscillibacter sp.]|nr:hypothetical protein [Oscillibacter sp.]